MQWKVSTNKTKFDWKLAREWLADKGEFVLYQSKGRAKMKLVPNIGDEVIIVCDKKEVLKGRVIDGFKEGTRHQVDDCIFSKGSNQGHREPTYHAAIQITALGDLSENRGCQRTWTTYKKRCGK